MVSGRASASMRSARKRSSRTERCGSVKTKILLGLSFVAAVSYAYYLGYWTAVEDRPLPPESDWMPVT